MAVKSRTLICSFCIFFVRKYCPLYAYYFRAYSKLRTRKSTLANVVANKCRLSRCKKKKA